jgi:hypothetical protein
MGHRNHSELSKEPPLKLHYPVERPFYGWPLIPTMDPSNPPFLPAAPELYGGSIPPAKEVIRVEPFPALPAPYDGLPHGLVILTITSPSVEMVTVTFR